MSQITHTGSPKRQLVSAEGLRRILRASGDSRTRPSDFSVGDEWDAGGAACRFCARTFDAHEDGCPESERA